MKRTLVAVAVSLIGFLSLPHAASAFGWKDVVRMHEDGIADSLIIQKIDHSGKSFSLKPGQINSLKEAGVSDEVISAMLATEDRDDYDRYDDPYYRPRAYVGFGFRYYDGWPYYGSPYYGGYGSYRYHRDYYGRYDYRPRYYGYYRHSPNYGTQRQRTYVTPRQGWSGPGAGGGARTHRR